MQQKTLNWISMSGRLLGTLFYYSPDQPQAQFVIKWLQQPNALADWQNLNQPERIQHYNIQ